MNAGNIINENEFSKSVTESDAIHYLATRYYTHDIKTLPYEKANEKIKDVNILNRLYDREWTPVPLGDKLSNEVLKFLVGVSTGNRKVPEELMYISTLDIIKLFQKYRELLLSMGNTGIGTAFHSLTKSLSPHMYVGDVAHFTQFLAYYIDNRGGCVRCGIPVMNRSIHMKLFMDSDMKTRVALYSRDIMTGITMKLEDIRHIDGFENILYATSHLEAHECLQVIARHDLTPTLKTHERMFIAYYRTRIEGMITDGPVGIMPQIDPIGMPYDRTFMSDGDGNVIIEDNRTDNMWRMMISGRISIDFCDLKSYDELWRINTVIANGHILKGPYLFYRGVMVGKELDGDVLKSYPIVTERNAECPICYDTRRCIMFRCKHSVCPDCFPKIGDSCPLCRQDIIVAINGK